MNEWDITLTKDRPGGNRLQFHFPVMLSVPLIEHGYNRVRLSLTDEGLLLRPYVAVEKPTTTKPTVTLPDWGSE